MLPDTVGGLPTHVLVIHAVVVLVPLGVLGAVAYLLVPPWRASLRWTVLAVLTAGLVAVPVATQAGEALQADLTRKGQLGGQAADAVTRHAGFGDVVLWPVLATWLLYLLLLWVTRPPLNPRAVRTRNQRIVVACVGVALIVGAGASLTYVGLAGHSGAKAIWNPAG